MKLFSKKRKAASEVTPANLMLLNDNMPFAIREAYKSLYTNVLYLTIEDKCKKIAVTSAVSGECKSTVAVNLAISLSHNSEDKRILLIDTDMRDPDVAKIFGIDLNAPGLSEYLAGIDEKPNFVEYPDIGLTVLTAGGSNVNPTRLMGSKRMEELLKYCDEVYDYVIIDTPPLNVVTDAVLLNGHINGYIISTKADYSNVNAVNKCLETLDRVGAEVFGVVLSSLKLKSATKHYGKYGKYVK